MAIKYDNCKDCHSLCIHAGKDRDFICMNGVSCKITTEKPQSNADRIRSMSDDDLGKFLLSCCDWNILIDGVCDEDNCAECHDEIYNCTGNCLQAVVKWLQQPAE